MRERWYQCDECWRVLRTMHRDGIRLPRVRTGGHGTPQGYCHGDRHKLPGQGSWMDRPALEIAP